MARWEPKKLKNDALAQAINKAAKEQGISLTGDHITRLMSRSKLNWKWDVKDEQVFSIRLADALRLATKEKRLKCIWCHVANEGNRHIITTLILKAMGMISGATDFFFLAPFGGVIMELKFGDGALTPAQEDFRQWACDMGIPYFLMRAQTKERIDEKIANIFEILKDLGLYV